MLNSIQLQLLAVPGWTAVLIAIVTLLIGAGGTFVILKYLNFKNKEKIANANLEATKILEDARVEAKSIRKEASLEARDERQKLKNEFDKEVSESKKELEKEIKERRGELAKIEQRILQKEEASDKRESNLEKKQDLIETQKKDLESKELEIKNMEAEVKNSHDKMIKELERVAGLTRDEAKQSLINELIEDAKRDAGTLAKQIEQTAKDEAEKKAKNIVSLAIQKCATDHSSEITVSSVALPNEEMKGRIIGRVGRNIRALESATGVDLIIDDTPDVVTLSSFDPVRREVARITLEKLISDGRIHPARIEEMVEKVRREIDSLIKEAGDAAVFEAGLYNVHPEIIKLIGRLKYRTSYGQNVLKHSLEVSHLAGLMAAELGADVKIAKRGGLLHDLGKAVDQEVEGTHVSIGVDLAKKYKENKDVILCIAAHHGDTDPTTIEAILVQAADGISGGRPGARRESIENYIKRLEKLENVANSFKGVESSFAIQAGREIRVMVKPEVVDDASTIFMAKEIAQKLESELDYPGQIKVNVIRELRSIEYAK